MDKWNNLPLKWRKMVFISGIILLAAISYQFNIKKTSILIKDYYNLKDNIGKIPTNFRYVNDVDTNKSRGDKTFLKYLISHCDTTGVEVKEISQSYFTSSDSIVIETNKITLEGEYSNILQLIHHLENEKKIVAISSATWELYQDKTTGAYSLLSVLYIKHMAYEK